MEREPGVTALPKNLQFRVGLLLGLTLMVAIGFVVYVLYARGVFEARQRLTLVADNAEGVSIGMDLTFSGFPIGRVNRMALDEDGRARIDIDVPRKDARWLRTSSVFTIERGVVGSARIRLLRTAQCVQCCEVTLPRRSRAWSRRCARCWRTSNR